MPKIALLYTTFENKEQSETVARQMLESGLVGCVNQIGEGLSIFPWDGKICSNRESYLLLKCTLDKKREALKHLAALHPYDTPCLLNWEVEVNEAYFKWLNGKPN